MVKSIIKSLLITIIIGALYFYIALPPINIHSIEFYVFIFLIYLVFMGAFSFFEYGKFFDGKAISRKIKVAKGYKYSFAFIASNIFL